MNPVAEIGADSLGRAIAEIFPYDNAMRAYVLVELLDRLALSPAFLGAACSASKQRWDAVQIERRGARELAEWRHETTRVEP